MEKTRVETTEVKTTWILTSEEIEDAIRVHIFGKNVTNLSTIDFDIRQGGGFLAGCIVTNISTKVG